MKVKGYIEKIKYRNPDNGYTIADVSLSMTEYGRLKKELPEYADELEPDITCKGTFPLIDPGEYAEFEGSAEIDNNYGIYFKVRSFERKAPEGVHAVERYLASGAIKGIGETMAARIVKRFGEDTLRIMEEEPERLAEVKGISETKAIDIADQVVTKKEMRDAMMFLTDLGISMNLSVKIYKQYGSGLYDIIRDNPYRLAEDIDGVGFKIADEIAGRAGIPVDSDYRIRSGILYALQNECANGHVYVPGKILMSDVRELLQESCSEEDIDRLITELAIDSKLVVKNETGSELSGDNAGSEPPGKRIYLKSMYMTELDIARRLIALDHDSAISDRLFDRLIEKALRYENTELDELQISAIKYAATHGVTVITGGPGTGKTTTINTMIRFFEEDGLNILLAAPTGRAAKRMTETTGHDALTLHRLLEFTPAQGMLDGPDKGQNKAVFTTSGAHFNRNDKNPLECDVVIVDEVSMVDIFLMSSLLKAVPEGARLILVGDADQLPSVGPGNVLGDIIDSQCFDTVKLTKIYRQSEAGDIVLNAHKINTGEPFTIGPSSKEFPFIKREDADSIIGVTAALVSIKLPGYVDCSPEEVQVLTPMKKGALGTIRLNAVLQQQLNPEKPGKQQTAYGDVIYREGDKVMQIKNDYDKTWEIRGHDGMILEKGSGVFNGDMGIIVNISHVFNEVSVRFDGGRIALYEFKELDEIEHAYAVTVHKAQGSEYPAVVFPLLSGPRMLMNRNILYTAVTRARKCICIVGSDEAFYSMAAAKSEYHRYTSLAERLIERKNGGML